MKYCSENQINDLFELINKLKINYILLRNIGNEIPKKLPINKDIDLLVKEEDANRFDKLLIENGWKRKRHPLGHFPFLYGLKPFKFYYKDGIHLDICYQLACRSLNNGEWFPLDMIIQKDLWLNKIQIKNKSWEYKLSKEDEFLHLITRCVFDKKHFNSGYIERIEELIEVINTKSVLDKFEVVFFKFSQTLLIKLQERKYETIINNYLQFREY